MQNQDQILAKCGKKNFNQFILLPLIIAAIFGEIGCVSSTNQTTRNFPAINDYINERMSMFNDWKLYELRMQAVPSPEGGEIVVSGYVYNQTTAKIVAAVFSAPALPPAKVIWKVQVDPVRAPNHNIYDGR